MMLAIVASALQDLYQLDPIPALDACFITEEQMQRYRALHPDLHATARETLLIEQDGDDLFLGLYIAPEILQVLQRDDPSHCLHEGNIEAACIAIEGVSHLLCAWWKLHRALPCSQLELEIQAEVDKYLICARWLRQQGQSGRHLLARLFQQYALHGGVDQAAAHRYHRASVIAYRVCASCEDTFLRPHRIPALVAHMRAFYRLTHWQKLRLP